MCVAPGVASGLEGSVKVTKVGLVDVGGCHVGDGAEPPCEDDGFWVRTVVVSGRRRGKDFEIAVVGVNGWDTGVTGVDDEAETGCEKGETLIDVFEGCVSGAHLLDSSRGEDAVYRGDVDGGFLDRMICPSRMVRKDERRERTYWRWKMGLLGAGMCRRDHLHPHPGSTTHV